MENLKVDNKRISKNAALLYVRMAVTMIVSIYTSRVILQVLGVSDYGIYNVVWGITSVIVFFNGSLQNVAQRYLNLGIGEGSLTLTTQYFNQFLVIFSFLSLCMLVVGEICMRWVIYEFLVIPSDRLVASLWIYQSSLMCLVLSIFVIPYTSAVIAHERMDVFASITIFETFSRLGILYIIQLWDGDNLIHYAIGLFCIQVLLFFFYVSFVRTHFKESIIHFYFNRKLLREMTTFVGYNMYGCFAFAICQQGINVLINIFFSPVINAARAISMQVYSAVYKFSDNILMAVRPPIIKLYANDEKNKMIDIAFRTTRYCLFINTLIALPIAFCIDTILQLWLETVPDYTNIFVIIVLLEGYINIMCQMFATLVNATGNLKWNQFYGRTYTLISIPLAYCFLLVWKSPMVPVLFALLGTLGYFLCGLYDIHIQFKVRTTRYIKEIIFPILCFNFILVVVLSLIKIMPVGKYVQLLDIFVADVIIGVLLIYTLFLDHREKDFVKSKIQKVIKK